MSATSTKRCSACNREFQTQAAFCPFDGQNLVDSASAPAESTVSIKQVETEPAARPYDTPADSNIGRIIDDRYKIIEPIGRGGMGTVYRALHLRLNRMVAIKIINKENNADPVALERFRREAQVLGAITHPNAVNVIDFGVTSDELAYLVMEMLNGINFRNVIVREAPLTLPRINKVLRQICEAVYAAHRVGVIHRDLKPDNIMLVDDPREGELAKVLDFGIAKLRDTSRLTNQLTAEGMIFGTPRYMSPEACHNYDLTPASDTYAIGVILFEMLTGRAPFEARAGQSQFELALQHLTDMPSAPSTYNSDVPAEVDAIVLKALSKAPEDRQETPVVLADEFDAAFNHALETMGKATDLLPSVEIKAEPTEPLPTPKITTPPPTKPEQAPSKSSVSALALVFGAAVLLVVVALSVAVLGWMAGAFERGTDPTTTGPQPPVTTGETPAPPETTTPTAPEGMVFVPGGTLRMGEDTGPPDSKPQDPYARPAHEVTVAPFFLDRFEVTNAEYRAFVDATNHPPPDGWTATLASPGWERLPVTGVSWVDAIAYADWAGKRLPTEEEWEFAARSTEGRIFPWGNEWDASRSIVEASVATGPEPVGSRPAGATPLSVQDLAGSVWEWTSSNYSTYPGGPEATIEMRTMKIVRGGSYTSEARDQRSAYRNWQNPNLRDPRVGFRCAQSIGQ